MVRSQGVRTKAFAAQTAVEPWPSVPVEVFIVTFGIRLSLVLSVAEREVLMIGWVAMNQPPPPAAPMPAQSPQPGWNPAMVLAMASFGGFLVTFMTSSVNVALPLIEEDFHMSAVTLSWVSLSYILVGGATLLPLGRISDLYGRMRFFIYGVIIFTIFSFASAVAPSAAVL